jgi:predicted nucleic acid-binding Zn ribbon protein
LEGNSTYLANAIRRVRKYEQNPVEPGSDCVVCGEPLPPNKRGRRRLYCSVSCLLVWARRDLPRQKKPPEPTACIICGNLNPPSTRTPRVYCSPRCARVRANSLRRATNDKKPRPTACKVCGGPMPDRCDRRRMYCSEICSNRSKGITPLAELLPPSLDNCANCGGEIVNKKPGRKYCSRRCLDYAKHRKWTETNPDGKAASRRRKKLKARERRLEEHAGTFSPVSFPTCWHCGQRFTARDHAADTCAACLASWAWVLIHACKDCGADILSVRDTGAHRPPDYCDPCGAKRQKLTRQKVRKERRAKGLDERSIKRRCKFFGVEYDKAVTPLAVFERDKWKCHLCGCRVHKSKRKGPNDPRAAQLDHIIPLANRTVGHTWENVRTACRECNMRKRDTPRGQLILIGSGVHVGMYSRRA